MLDPPTAQELRAGIPWVDGHANVWRLFADRVLFGRCVLALVRPYENDGITHVAAIESRGFVLGGAAATALGVGFVAVRKASGHLPGSVLTHEAGPDYKGQTAQLRLQADVLPVGRARPGGRRLARDRQPVSSHPSATRRSRRHRRRRERHRERGPSSPAAAAGQVPSAHPGRKSCPRSER